MECLACTRSTTRVREAVDVVADRRVGHCCELCLRRRFGWTITDPAWQRETGCAVCERDASFVLRTPEKPVDSEVIFADGGVESVADVGLCDEHFHSLVTDRDGTGVGHQDGTQQGPRAPPDRR